MPARTRRPDHFTRRAQAQGQPARSVFKLEEMDRRWRLLRPGHRVLDLGAAPGSWLAYAAARVGPRGWALGVDLKPLAPSVALPPWAQFEEGDAWALDDDGGPLDVVLSDMAPSTSGDAVGDGARSAALAERALDLALARGRAGSHLVVKLLESAEAQILAGRIKVHYQKLERLRPAATRRHSREIFLVGLGRRSAPPVPAS